MFVFDVALAVTSSNDQLLIVRRSALIEKVFRSEGYVDMSKKDLIDAVANHAEITKEKAGHAVEAVLEHIKKSM